MKKKRPIITLVISIAALVVVSGFLFHQQRALNFSDILPLQSENITHCSIQIEESESNLKLDEGQTGKLLQLMQEFEYKKVGHSNGLQDCYARIFLWETEANRVEIMVSPDAILINSITSDKRSTKYSFDTESSTKIKLMIDEIRIVGVVHYD